jgi:hypothetical protein
MSFVSEFQKVKDEVERLHPELPASFKFEKVLTLCEERKVDASSALTALSLSVSAADASNTIEQYHDEFDEKRFALITSTAKEHKIDLSTSLGYETAMIMAERAHPEIRSNAAHPLAAENKPTPRFSKLTSDELARLALCETDMDIPSCINLSCSRKTPLKSSMKFCANCGKEVISPAEKLAIKTDLLLSEVAK